MTRYLQHFKNSHVWKYRLNSTSRVLQEISLRLTLCLCHGDCVPCVASKVVSSIAHSVRQDVSITVWKEATESVLHLSCHSLIRVHASVCVRILSHSSSLWIVIGRVWIQIPQVLLDRDTNTDCCCSCPSSTGTSFRTALNGFTTGTNSKLIWKQIFGITKHSLWLCLLWYADFWQWFASWSQSSAPACQCHLRTYLHPHLHCCVPSPAEKKL